MNDSREWIAGWCFSVQSEEFRCDFFNDDSCDFYFWADHDSQQTGDKNIFLEAAFGIRNARQKIENHAREFTITVNNIEPQLILDIMKLEDKIDNNDNLTSNEEQAIDRRIAPYFWEHVNPFLTSPLKK